MTGQTIVMTGGLGGVAVRAIARCRPGAHFILLARGRPDGLMRDLRENGADAIAISTDLQSLRSVRDAADEAAALVAHGTLPAIDALVCNAGIMRGDALTHTPDGLEATFAVNVIANHVLMERLSPDMANGSRIVVTVAQKGGAFANFGLPAPKWAPAAVLARPGAFSNPDSLQAGLTAYTTSKLGAIYLVHEAARRLPDGVSAYSFCPRIVRGTGLLHDLPPRVQASLRGVQKAMAITTFTNTAEAAGQALANAVTGQVAAPSGALIDMDREAPSPPQAYDPDRERDVWETSAALSAQALT